MPSGQQASQSHEMYCHDLEVMSSNPSQVELGVRSTSVKSYLIQKCYRKANCMAVLPVSHLQEKRFRLSQKAKHSPALHEPLKIMDIIIRGLNIHANGLILS